ncbi:MULTISPECIES: hypothetical protein [unclassified Meiothermus]|uniref:hypothetical protein n=1 Tax=unclassified Meiothermus TaxID=370471 RepID=UPI000D7C7E49|nr:MULTISPECIES: hypothetical protein [unclassified Meiothermus]PZA06386.1 hypothetical protein DNA98_13490 [Meiothermus sp. Pnk-1]RYM36995.1 hypothetical protein EWH23_07840 [Meiothermus sp. PNK-Is4]
MAKPSLPPADSTRLIGAERYALLGTFPRPFAEGIRVRLEGRKIPVFLETPFTYFGLPEAYIGTYTGDVALWIPQRLYDEALMILERDQ